MLGSTFIFETDRKRLLRLRRDLGALDRLVHVGLERMTTIDFQQLIAAPGRAWSQPEPVFFDEEAGAVLVGVREEGLRAVLDLSPNSVPEHAQDLGTLQGFIREHGSRDIYELATF